MKARRAKLEPTALMPQRFRASRLTPHAFHPICLMSFTLHGIGVSGSVAIGRAHLVSHATLEVNHFVIPPHQVMEESLRFEAAIHKVRAEFDELQGEIPAGAPAEFSAFVNLHRMILDDAMLSQEPRRIIETEQCNAEWAVKVQSDALLAQFDQIEDNYLQERKADVIQVVERLMKVLLGRPGYAPPASDDERNLILVAHDLTPSETATMNRKRVTCGARQRWIPVPRWNRCPWQRHICGSWWQGRQVRSVWLWTPGLWQGRTPPPYEYQEGCSHV